MNAQNNTPQQHPAAAASSPTESDLWEAAFSSDDPTVVLTDEELNAEYIMPMAFDKKVIRSVADAVAQAARDSGVARI